MPAFFVCIIVLVLRLRFHPPQPSALRAAIQRQQRREAEVTQAHEIAEKGEGAQVLEEAQRPRASSSTSSGSEAGASTTGDGGSKSQPVEAGIASTMATIRKESAKASKRSQYGLAADAARRYGHEATVLTGSLADAHERAKNMALWRAPVATVRALVWLGLMAFGSLYLTPWILVRSIGLLLGALFFVLLPIVEYHPELLPKDNPVDLLLAGVPNDAQCAIQILRKRAAAGQPLVSDPALLLSASSAEGEGGGQGGINKLSRRSMESSSSSASLSSLAPSAMQAEREAGAKDAKEGNKVDWGKWRARAARGRDMAIKGSEMLAGHRGIYLPRVVVSKVMTVTLFALIK